MYHKKIVLFFIILFTFIGVKAQTPVVISQPYIFKKYVSVNDSLILLHLINNPGIGHLSVNAHGKVFLDTSTNGGKIYFNIKDFTYQDTTVSLANDTIRTGNFFVFDATTGFGGIDTNIFLPRYLHSNFTVHPGIYKLNFDSLNVVNGGDTIKLKRDVLAISNGTNRTTISGDRFKMATNTKDALFRLSVSNTLDTLSGVPIQISNKLILPNLVAGSGGDSTLVIHNDTIRKIATTSSSYPPLSLNYFAITDSVRWADTILFEHDQTLAGNGHNLIEDIDTVKIQDNQTIQLHSSPYWIRFLQPDSSYMIWTMPRAGGASNQMIVGALVGFTLNQDDYHDNGYGNQFAYDTTGFYHYYLDYNNHRTGFKMGNYSTKPNSLEIQLRGDSLMRYDSQDYEPVLRADGLAIWDGNITRAVIDSAVSAITIPTLYSADATIPDNRTVTLASNKALEFDAADGSGSSETIINGSNLSIGSDNGTSSSILEIQPSVGSLSALTTTGSSNIEATGSNVIIQSVNSSSINSISLGQISGSAIVIENHADNKGIKYLDATSYSQIGTDTLSIPNLGWVQRYVTAHAGTGTVTSIATSSGITGGTITGTGTLKADTSVLQTVLNFFPKGDTRYAKISSIITYSNARGITLASNNFGLDTTQNYTWGKIQTFKKGIMASFNATTVTPIFPTQAQVTFAGADANSAVLQGQAFGGHVVFEAIRTDGTNASPTAVVNNDELGTYAYNGYDGTSIANEATASVQASATENWSATAHGTQLIFNTTPNTTTALTAGAVLDGNGNFGVVGNESVGSSTGANVLSYSSGSTALTVLGANNASARRVLELVGPALNTANVVGEIDFDALSNTLQSNYRVVQMFAVPSGSTSGNRGGAFTLATKVDGGSLTNAFLISNAQVITIPHYTTNNGLLFTNGSGVISQSTALPSGTTATTQSSGDNSTNVATTAYVDRNAQTKTSADLTAQTTAVTVGTFTVGASTATFNISAYLNITAVTVDVIEMQVTYTDENSTSQTATFFTQGATSALLSTIGNSVYPPLIIRAKNATTITVKTTLTTGTGSIAYDAGTRIIQM